MDLKKAFKTAADTSLKDLADKTQNFRVNRALKLLEKTTEVVEDCKE